MILDICPEITAADSVISFGGNMETYYGHMIFRTFIIQEKFIFFNDHLICLLKTEKTSCVALAPFVCFVLQGLERGGTQTKNRADCQDPMIF